MITAIAHICLRVKDLSASLEFYCDKLCLKRAFEFRDAAGNLDGIYLHVGGRGFLELFERASDAPCARQSSGHFCLETDDIHRTLAELRGNSVDVSEITCPASDSSLQAWLTDPDGNRIELHQYTAESKQKLAMRDADKCAGDS